MSDDAKKRSHATILFQTGSNAVKANNLDYAIDCFANCAKMVPTHLPYRQALREAEKRKYQNNGKGAAGAGMRNSTAKLKLKTTRARRKWNDVLIEAEEILKLNPWDVDALMEIAAACKELEGMAPTGLWVMRSAAEVVKDRADVYKVLAHFYEENKLFKEAIAALERAKQLDPKDQEIPSKINQLGASMTMHRSGMDAGEGRLGPGNSGGGGGGAGQTAAQVDTVEGRLRREVEGVVEKLKADPGNASLYVQGGDAYRKLGEVDKARDLYEQGHKVTEGRDQDLTIRVLEIRLDALRAQQTTVRAQADKVDRQSPDARDRLEEFQRQLRQLHTEILRGEAGVFRGKTQVNPDDATAFLELGVRLLQLKEVDEAIRALQVGRGDPRNRWKAYMYLGVAFMQKGNFALADKSLQEGSAALPTGDEGAKKEILYYRARVAEARNLKEQAVDYYNEIANMDYGYKDVAKRLDALTGPAAGAME